MDGYPVAMKIKFIESIRLKNFKSFKNVTMDNIPPMSVILGANGTGKSTLFNIFGFLKEALITNVNNALYSFGGSNGFQEVRSRGCEGAIEIELKIREKRDSHLVTYFLAINEENGKAFVEKEFLRYRRSSLGQPWQLLNFAKGTGEAVTNESKGIEDEKELRRERVKLRSNDVLAVKALAQLEKFPTTAILGNLIENWHMSDLHIGEARPEQKMQSAKHLSKSGDNLSSFIDYLCKHHKDKFKVITKKLAERVPDLERVEAVHTDEGKMLLKFHHHSFGEPVLARFASDGTIKMLAYLALLNDPEPHSLLCVEEPENQLYPYLLEELAEEFRAYSADNNQVFISTHSPDFLNAAEIDEVFWLQKEHGYTQIKRASDDDQIKRYMDMGDKMGNLWKQGFFEGADPQ